MLRTVKSTRANLTTLSTIWLAAALVFFICEAIAASVSPDYSYATNYISELGVPGSSPLAVVMNLGFWLQGMLFLIGAVVATRESATGRRRLFIVLVAMTALGDVLVATFHGNSLATGHYNAAFLHWVGSLLAILGGNAAIIAGSSVVAGLVKMRWYRAVSVSLAVLGFLSLLFLGHAVGQLNPGLFERGAVYPMFLWQMFSAVLLIARRRADTPPAKGTAERHLRQR
jgi:hypothetical membrane protein